MIIQPVRPASYPSLDRVGEDPATHRYVAGMPRPRRPGRRTYPGAAGPPRRLPRSDGRAMANWLLSHLPITMSIAAAGAAMVSLIEHAHDARTPPGTSWLLAGAVALSLLALAVTERTLVDAQRLVVVYQPLSVAMGAGRPQPSLSAGLARRRGCWRCCSGRSSRCSGSSPSAASCAPTRGAKTSPAPVEVAAPSTSQWRAPTGRPWPLIQVAAARRGARLATTSAGVRRGDHRRRARGHPPQALVFSA